MLSEYRTIKESEIPLLYRLSLQTFFFDNSTYYNLLKSYFTLLYMVSCWFVRTSAQSWLLVIVGWCYSVVTWTRPYTIVIPLLPCPDADKRRQTSSQTVVVADKVVASPGNRQMLPKASNHSLHRLLCGEKKQH